MVIVKSQILQRISQRFRARVLEWEHSIMCTLWGMIIILNPAVFQGPGFVAFLGGPTLWGWLVMLSGMACLIALGINGYMARPTAMARTISAGLRIILFSLMSLGFLFSWQWSTALAVYPVVAGFGLFPLFWTLLDVAAPDDHA